MEILKKEDMYEFFFYIPIKFVIFRDAPLFMHTTPLTRISFVPPISLILDKDTYT